MVLSQKQIEDLDKVVNKLPMQRLIDYVKNGTITESVLQQLPHINAERKKQLLAIVSGQNTKPEEQQKAAPMPSTPPTPLAAPTPSPHAAPRQPMMQKQPVEPSPTPSSITSMDIETAWKWMPAHRNDPNFEVVRQHFIQLKLKELAAMREELSTYPPDRVFHLLEKGIVSEEDLLNSGLATPASLNILRQRDEIIESLPDINVEIAKCHKECAEDHTDVFLFGIPSTGKTCILMGLIGSPNININTVRAGGPYACVLEQFLDAGLTIGQTPKDFVATIEASIQDGVRKQQLNLIEMAGEDFAFKIADNEEGTVSLEDIATGATKLLCNNNRKSFFIIVDPTAKRIAFNHLVNETDAEGNVRTYLVRKNVNQKIILKRLVDLLAQPENKAILKNVDSISIVISKADLLGDGQEREQEAYSRFMDQHKNIINPLIDLCRENGINMSTNGQPMLYTFSLGHFYVGGVYQYDPTDANKLIEVLKGNTEIS